MHLSAFKRSRVGQCKAAPNLATLFSENHFAVKLCSHKKMMLVLVQLRYLTLTSFRSPLLPRSLSSLSLSAYGAREVILNARH